MNQYDSENPTISAKCYDGLINSFINLLSLEAKKKKKSNDNDGDIKNINFYTKQNGF
jgi:hypothetical protein